MNPNIILEQCCIVADKYNCDCYININKIFLFNFSSQILKSRLEHVPYKQIDIVISFLHLSFDQAIIC